MGRRAYELLGDAYRAANSLEAAREAYTKARAISKLREIGADEIADRISYRKGHPRPFNATLSAKGDEMLAAGNVQGAITKYREAGATEKLVALGDSCLARNARNDTRRAHEAYVAARAHDRLRTLGALALSKGWLSTALRAFIAAQDRDGAESVGDIAFAKAGVETEHVAYGIPPTEAELLLIALHAYEYARVRGKLVLVGQRFVAMGDADLAVSAFRAAARLEAQG